MSEAASPMERVATESLRVGREALARHAWTVAFENLSQADRDGQLSGTDLEGLGEAAFFAAHANLATEVYERAFKARVAEGDPVRAAYLALAVARDYTYVGKGSIAAAWTRRAERLLADQAESYAHGYLALTRSDAAKAAGDIEAALELAEEAVQVATRAAHPDLQATALTALGMLKISTGATSDGFAMMEEASVAAVNGELSPFVTGVTHLHDDLGVSRPDRLSAGHRVDRGDRALLRAPVPLRLSRRVPDPPSRNHGTQGRVGSSGAGARAGDRRARRLQRDPTPRGRLLRARRDPAIEGRPGGGGGGRSPGTRARADSAAGPRPDPAGRGKRPRGSCRDQDGARGDDLESMGTGAPSAGASRDCDRVRRPRPGSRGRRGADRDCQDLHLARPGGRPALAALAGAGEILATAETLADAGDTRIAGAKEATFKGVTGPVNVASVEWT